MQKWSQMSSPKNKSKEFVATKQITVLEHPAYSPDLAPSNFSVPEMEEGGEFARKQRKYENEK